MYGGTWPPPRCAPSSRTDKRISLDGVDYLIDALPGCMGRAAFEYVLDSRLINAKAIFYLVRAEKMKLTGQLIHFQLPRFAVDSECPRPLQCPGVEINQHRRQLTECAYSVRNVIDGQITNTLDRFDFGFDQAVKLLERCCSTDGAQALL